MSEPVAPNLSWITDELAVGGRMPSDDAGDVLRCLGIRAVVDLRSEDRDDEVLLCRDGVLFLHLPTDDHCAPTPEALRDGVAFVSRELANGRKVLIHCEHGIGRSATLALCVLVERGHEPIEAVALMKDKREVFSPSPAQYECWATWLRERAARGSGMAIPDFNAFAAIAYRHLRRP